MVAACTQESMSGTPVKCGKGQEYGNHPATWCCTCHDLFVVVEKPWPHRSAVWRTTRLGLEMGREYYRKRLRLMELCKQSGYYPAYTAGGKNKVDPFKLFEFVETV